VDSSWLKLTIAALAVLFFLCSCETEENSPPVIESISADPQTIYPSDLTVVSCQVIDFDQDVLEYIWSCSTGTFQYGIDSWRARWQAPPSEGVYSIYVTVSDGEDTDHGSVEIEVEENAAPTAVFTAEPGYGNLETVFTVDASESSDHETPVEQLEVRWDWEDDGVYDTDWSTTKTATHQFDVTGVFTIRLQVKDDQGLMGETDNTVVVSVMFDPDQLVLVPAGTFMMGQDWVATPVHSVTLTNDFYLGTHEVTNEEYCAAVQWAYDLGLVTADSTTVEAYGEELLDLDAASMISFSEGVFSLVPVEYGDYQGQSNAEHPIFEVSWYGAACYCDWLSLMDGLGAYYNGIWNQTAGHNPYSTLAYRLPTEAEWEYAAQYDDDRDFPWGDADPDCSYANFTYLGEQCVGWTAPVGCYQPGTSQLGFMDLAGNVLEWVGDGYGDYDDHSRTDPLGVADGSYRIARGGYWGDIWGDLRCAVRHVHSPSFSNYSLGFRICRTANP